MEFTEVVKNIYLLKAPFSTLWTGVVLVRGEKNFLIDSGADSPEKYVIPALSKLGLSISDIDYLLNTHCHGDHIGGHSELKEKYSLTVVAADTALTALKDPAANAVRIRTRFPENSPPPQSWLKGVEADKVLYEGDVLEGRLKLILTPGHDSDCVCWLDTKTNTLITGDSVQGNGTPSQGVGFYQSLDGYLSSMEKLLSLDVDNMILGHEYDGIGSVVIGKDNVRESLEYSINMTREYEKRIFAYVKEGAVGEVEIAKRLINEVGCGMPERLFLALYTVVNHLERIRKEI